MGTNYYAHTDVCKHCNRPDKILHIGKSSGGWQFNFQSYTDYYSINIKSYKNWLDFLQKSNTIIVDEYNKAISLDDFKKMVEDKKNLLDSLKEYPEMSEQGKSWYDQEGYIFSDYEFS